MNPKLLPAAPRDDTAGWERTLMAFLAEKQRRSGSHRTVESYSRMLWPFFNAAGSPETITPAHALAWAHGIGRLGTGALVDHRRRPDRVPLLLLSLLDPDERPDRQPV